MSVRVVVYLFLSLLTMTILSCGNAANKTSVRAYSVGGTISGLAANATVILQNNGKDNLIITHNDAFNGVFQFPGQRDGSNYHVTVLQQPDGQSCSVEPDAQSGASSGDGVVRSKNINFVTIVCVNKYKVGGVVQGIGAQDSLVLQINGRDSLTLTGTGGPFEFTFSSGLPDGGVYEVVVLTPPASTPFCNVVYGMASNIIKGADVNTVKVICSNENFTVPVLKTEALDHGVTLRWEDTGAANYTVYYSSQAGFDPDKLGAGDSRIPNVTSPHLVTGLTNGKPYYFILESDDKVGPLRTPSQGTRPNPLATTGSVRAIATDADGTTYIGGTFESIGTATGAGIPFDTSTGKPSIPDFPILTGGVATIISDRKGGWYIGGLFTCNAAQGVTVSNLAHILADGSVDPLWTQSPEGPVFALFLSGDVLYVGGLFSVTADNKTSHNFVTYYTRDGRVGNTLPEPNGAVYALASDGSYLFIGGDFTTLDGSSAAPYLAAYNLANGNWERTWSPNPGGLITALKVSGNTVYAGGSFVINGSNGIIKNLAAIAVIDSGTAIGSGKVDFTWAPNPIGPDSYGVVKALALDGDKLYVGGSFTSIFGGDAQYLAVVGSNGSSAGKLPVPDNEVDGLAIGGGKLYMGGKFTSINDSNKNHTGIQYMSAINTADGTVDAKWSPNPNSFVRALAASGNIVYAGGDFGALEYDLPKISRLAKISPEGILDRTWAPNPNNRVYALQSDGNTLYVGGTFTAIGNSAAVQRLAAIDENGTLISGWAPNPDDEVSALSLDTANNKLYVGGYFTDIGKTQAGKNTAIPILARVDTGTGAVDTGWAPNLSGGVDALALKGNTVYVGGAFSNSAGNYYLTAIDSTGNAVGGFPTTNGLVHALAVENNVLYVGGNFTVGTAPIANLAAFDITDNNNVTLFANWDPKVSTNITDSVDAIAVHSAMVYVAGGFDSIGGSSINNLAAVSGVIDANSTANINTGWIPSLSGNMFYSLHVLGDVIYIGGGFENVGRPNQEDFAKIGVDGIAP